MSQPRWLTVDEERAWRQYRRMNRLLYSRIAQDLDRDSGLSEADYDVLSTLTEAEGDAWRAGELAERLQWSTSRLAHHVGRMERRGLVARASPLDDGRGALIRLTRAGRETIESAAPGHVRSVRRHFVNRLTRDQLRTLEEIAGAVVGPLEASP